MNEYTVKQAAERLGVSAPSVYNMIKDGRLPTVIKYGPRCWKIPAEDVQRVAARRGDLRATALAGLNAAIDAAIDSEQAAVTRELWTARKLVLANDLGRAATHVALAMIEGGEGLQEIIELLTA